MSALSETRKDHFLESCDLLHSADAVDRAIEVMAASITQEFDDKNPLLLCVMNGGLVFTGKLLPKLRFPLQVDYLHATRYRGEERGADVEWLAKPSTPIVGRHIIVLDDILDEGLTLRAVIEYCQQQGAADVKVAAMIEKSHGRNSSGVFADFVGLPVVDRYVFGLGMDYQGMWRNADGIYALKDS